MEGPGENLPGPDAAEKIPNGHGGLPTPQRFNLTTHNPSTDHEEAEQLSDEAYWKWKVGRQLREMGLMLRAAHAENVKLREELKIIRTEEGDGQFLTPDGESKADRRPHQGVPEPPGAACGVDPGLHLGSEGRPHRATGGMSSQGASKDVSNDEAASRAEGSGFPQKGAGSTDPQMQFMCLMLQSMQEMQRQMTDKDKGQDRDCINGEEVIRTGITELPPLPEWDASEAPLKLGDWLTLISPMVADLTSSAEDWWTLMLKEVGEWYQGHLAMSPLERTNHSPTRPESLQDKKWRRLERRVAGLMLKAVPEGQREDLVAKKHMSVFGILASLQISYQPGGFGEKRTLLKNLEEPAEATTASEAVTALRKWIRWRQSTEEIHATEPDPTVLMKGLSRLVYRVLESHQELQFRVSLARSSLLVDSTPTKESVTRYATHLLAELEQVAYTERKPLKQTKDLPKVKRIEEDAKRLGKVGDGKLKEVKKDVEDSEKPKPVCKFYNTDQGCRKGRQCRWLHQPDDRRRCCACGSTKHMAPACPIAGSETGPRTKTLRETGDQVGNSASQMKEADACSDGSHDAGTMQNLIAEATQMLKSMSTQQRTEPGATSKPSLDDLQRQLNELRGSGGCGPRIKTFRLTKMRPEGADGMALLDSGATHPLRSLVSTDDLSSCQKVWVTLADGHRVPMLMTTAGVMLSTDQKVEPIIQYRWDGWQTMGVRSHGLRRDYR